MDVLETVCGIHIIYQIACLSPCTIDRKAWILKRSKLLEIYSIAVVVTSLAFMLFGLFAENHLIKMDNNDLEQTLNFLQTVGMRVSHIVSVSEGLFRRKEQIRFYQEVKEIDRIFERYLNVDVNNKKFRRTTLTQGIVMAFVYLFAEFYILTSKLVSQEESFIIYWILYLIPLLVCGIRYFQIFTSMRILKNRFDLLVTVLSQINQINYARKQQQSKREASKNLTDNTKVRVFTDQNYSLALLELCIFKNSPCDMENSDLKKLLIVRELYNRLFNVNEIVNCYFGVSMLINVGNGFITITSNCYWIFYNFHDFYTTRNIFSLIVYSSVWSLTHLMNVVMLAILCERTVQKVNEIALNLYRINVDIWNDNLNTVIEQFSLQLLHQKLSITAAGFFNVDCTLLYTIVGATTTYLIILIQFHMN